jgi:dTDP-glucose pyrophosphorylase/CBS domain-containing protein
MRPIQDISLSTTATVRHAMEKLDSSRAGIILVLAETGHLAGTVTDGDVRRSVLAQRSLTTPITDIMCHRPITASPSDSLERVRELMDIHRIRHLPLVDAAGMPTRLYELQDLVHRTPTFPCAVIMAGGEGQRLRPLTEQLPKPMLKVGKLPILEQLVKTLSASGIADLYVAVNYKAKVIEDYCGDGRRWHVRIRYLRETQKLGTAGPLTLLPEIPSGPFLVVNGDIVTTSDFSSLYDYHWRHRCVITVGVTVFQVRVPYGVVNLAEHYVLSVDEKPIWPIVCNAGIYAVNPEVLTYLPRGRAVDMTDLLAEMVRNGLPVTAFAIHESWVDVGQLHDLRKAQQQYRRRPGRTPPNKPSLVTSVGV